MVVYIIFFRQPGLRSFSDFPVIYGGHTAVHLLDVNGVPYEPATMAFVRGEPVFYKLYTNETIGSYTAYTRLKGRAAAYKSIYTSEPLHRGYNLYQLLMTKPFVPRSAAIKRIYAERKRVWWERCVRDWEDYHRSL
jgi:hypothetical protein